MKRLLLLLLPVLITGCHSTAKYNQEIKRLKSPDELRADVDYAYKKITKLHPDLYWYISEKDFRYKFDSLKATLNEPLDSYAFYEKLAPLVASVRQGHMILRPPTVQFGKKEAKALVKKGKGPFSQFDFGMYDNRMYVLKNNSYDPSITPGSEVMSINRVPVSDLVRQFSSTFASDGFNTTFKRSRIERSFAAMYSAKNGVLDSLTYEIKTGDSLRWVTILRKDVDKDKKKDTTAKPAVKVARVPGKIRRKKGYNFETGLYNRNLRFIDSDSGVAVLKIRAFTTGPYRKFYKEAFQRIKDRKAHTLVLDLRDNPGGRLSEILNLYGYMADSTYTVCEPALVTSRTSLWHAGFWDDLTVVGFPFRVMAAPAFYAVQYFRVSKHEDGKFYADVAEKVKLKDERFTGKIYVLINGGSFSASSVISTLLKGSRRAYFVGEETGGAYNGTVAGQMPTFKLPNTKALLKIGLMKISTVYRTEPDGRGVFPDKEIVPSLANRLSGKDAEIDWVLEDVHKNRNSTAGNLNP